MKTRQLLVNSLLVFLFVFLSACSAATTVETGSQTASSNTTTAASVSEEAQTAVTVSTEVDYDAEDLAVNTSLYTLSYISLEGDRIVPSGSGLQVDGTVVTILAPGAYHISGTLADGQIRVDTQEDGTVVLLLDGMDITCSSSAAIYVLNAEKVILNLTEGSRNFVTDGSSYVFEDGSDEPDAAIYSRDDLVINGSGALTVSANYNHGIVSRDDLKITSGTITVTAVNDAIQGRDDIAVLDGTFTLRAGGDGLQSSNDEEASKGYIVIDGGSFDIQAASDGIQAGTSLTITGGSFTLTTGGGTANAAPAPAGMDDWGMGSQTASLDGVSAKALKAGTALTITGGRFWIDSSEDAMHANDSLTISGGDFTVAAGDDALHANSSVTINAGNLNVTSSYEGIESQSIVLNDGWVHLIASDDGLNGVSSSSDSQAGAMPGQDMFATGDSSLAVRGGYLYVDAGGDGIDIFGPIEMSAGTVIVNGPTNDGNGPLDYTGSFTMTGGLLVAVGSSGMAQAPSETSTQASLLYGYDVMQTAGTFIHIESADGSDLLTFAPAKAYQSIVFSSPALATGDYVLYSGGASTGTAFDGLSSGGTYTPGIQVTGFNLDGVVTTLGTVGRMGGGMGMPGVGPGGTHP